VRGTLPPLIRRPMPAKAKPNLRRTPNQHCLARLLKQENLCPEGLHRPHRDDAPCTYLRPPSLSPQASKPVDLHPHGDIPNLIKGPTDDLNIDYKKHMPHERDPNPLAGAKPPKGTPTHDGGLSKDAHIIMVPLGDPPREESPDQTPYQPPR
jgi:hypothetical protein